MKRKYTEQDGFRSFGITATLPGLKYAIEQLQAIFEELRAEVSESRASDDDEKPKRILSPEGSAAISAAQKRRWKAQKASAGTEARKRYWGSMTPEERTAEMKRRGMINPKAKKAKKAKVRKNADAALKQTAKQKPTVKLEAPKHPRDPRHPKHAQYMANLRAGVQRRYANMTPEQRRAVAAPLNRKAAA